MQKLLFVNVNQDTVDYIQRLQYDVNMRQRVVENLITNAVTDLSESPAYKKYQEELAEVNAEYSMAQGKLEHELLPVGFTTRFSAKWSLDFTLNKFIISVDSEEAVAALTNAGYQELDEGNAGCCGKCEKK